MSLSGATVLTERYGVMVKNCQPIVSLRLRAAAIATLALVSGACGTPETRKQGYFERGNRYAAEKQYDHAIVEYANAIRLDPKFGEARLKLAEAYEQTENYPAAMAEYIRAADALPDNRSVQLKATAVLLLTHRFEDARARATSLVAKNPRDVDALLLLANANAELKDTEVAVKQVEEAIKVRPDDSATFINLGAVKGRAGDNKQAEAAFRRAIALDPSSTRAHLALANYLMALGNMTEAEPAIAPETAG